MRNLEPYEGTSHQIIHPSETNIFWPAGLAFALAGSAGAHFAGASTLTATVVFCVIAALALLDF